MFGEVYSADQEIESTYVREGGLPATLDFSFQEAAKGFVTGAGSPQALADVYAKDALYTARDTDADRLPTFLGNHDMGRIGSFIESGGADPASYLRRDELAHELMFLTRGQPVVYSGDEQGFTGPGGDKDARQDMFASKTADYRDDETSAQGERYRQNYEDEVQRIRKYTYLHGGRPGRAIASAGRRRYPVPNDVW